MTSPALEVLTTVREALSDPERWYQGDTWPEGQDGDTATRACLIGACGIAGSDYPPQALYRAVEERGRTYLVAFNDDPSTTHADILAVLDRAIELAKEEEG